MKDDLLARVYRTLFEAANDPERPERALLSKDVAARIDADVEATAHALTQLHGAGLVTYLDGGPAFPIPWVLADKAPAAVHTVSVVIAEWLRWQGSDGVWRGPIHLTDVANLVENGAPFSPWEPAEPSERPGSRDAVTLVERMLWDMGGAVANGDLARTIVACLDPDVVHVEGPRYCHAARAVVLAAGHECGSDVPLYAGVRQIRSSVSADLDAAVGHVRAEYLIEGALAPWLSDDTARIEAARAVAGVLDPDGRRVVRAALPEREAIDREFTDAMREDVPPKHPPARAADRAEQSLADGSPTGRSSDAILGRHLHATAAGCRIDPRVGGEQPTTDMIDSIARSLSDVPWLVGRRDHLEGEVDRLCKVADEAGIPALRDALHDAGVVLTWLLGPDADLYALDAVRARDAVAAALGGMPHAARLPSPSPDAPQEARRAVAHAEGLAREVLADLVSVSGWGRAEPVARLADRLQVETADVVAAARGLLLLDDDRPDPDYLAAAEHGLFGLRESGTRSGVAWPLVADTYGRRLPPPAPNDEAAEFGEAFAERVLGVCEPCVRRAYPSETAATTPNLVDEFLDPAYGSRPAGADPVQDRIAFRYFLDAEIRRWRRDLRRARFAELDSCFATRAASFVEAYQIVRRWVFGEFLPEEPSGSGDGEGPTDGVSGKSPGADTVEDGAPRRESVRVGLRLFTPDGEPAWRDRKPVIFVTMHDGRTYFAEVGVDGRIGLDGLPAGAVPRVPSAPKTDGDEPLADGGVVRGDRPLAMVAEGGDGCVAPTFRREWRVAQVRAMDLREGDVVRDASSGRWHPVAAVTRYPFSFAEGHAGAVQVNALLGDLPGHSVTWSGLSLVDVQRADRVSLDGVRIEIHNPPAESASESVAERMRKLGFGEGGDAVPAP